MILIDALPKEREQNYGRMVRRRGAKVGKVRGVRREESDFLIRLTDSLCGFVRAAHAGVSETRALYESAIKQGKIKNLRD